MTFKCWWFLVIFPLFKCNFASERKPVFLPWKIIRLIAKNNINHHHFYLSYSG